ncbi:MAG: molybdopterin-dependent oxidoreductase [Acetobacteraceae bacterium]
MADALRGCPFVVVADCWPTDTTALAHVVLPAAGWGEKDGTVTNSERRISRQRPFRASPGLARPDWWMLSEVARRLGFGAAFDYAGPAAIFREHAALSAQANDGRRVFNLGALAALDDAGYDALQPVRWPLPDGGGCSRKDNSPRRTAAPASSPCAARRWTTRKGPGFSTPGACATNGTR